MVLSVLVQKLSFHGLQQLQEWRRKRKFDRVKKAYRKLVSFISNNSINAKRCDSVQNTTGRLAWERIEVIQDSLARILDTMDCSSMKLGFWISIVSGIPDSLMFLLDTKAQDFRFQKQNVTKFQNPHHLT